jgi:hypothetical protein
MVSQKPQAISGVSASSEVESMTVYPSVASTPIGKMLGQLLDSIPMTVCGIKLSHLLFGLPVGLATVPGFFQLRLFGERYTLTNRSVQRWKALGNSLIKQVPLTDIARVEIQQQPGQAFYTAADVYLVGRDGDTLLLLEGVSRADIFRETILKARDARLQTEAAMSMIQARQPA